MSINTSTNTTNTNPETAQSKVTGMYILAQALNRIGIDSMYGLVGIPVTDFAYIAQQQGIRFISFRHEQQAGMAAAAAGFLTKKPGVLLTVSSLGFLNGLTATANATVNCFPMIQISGSSEPAPIDLEQGNYEGLDQLNIAKPLVKAAYRVSRPEDIPTAVARAYRAAVSGRPGGVYLDVTTPCLGAVMDKEEVEKLFFTPIDPAPAMVPSSESIDRALALLSQAKQPAIILGKGAAYAQVDDKVKQFVEMTGIPFLPMSMAKGLLPDNHPLSAISARSHVMQNADVVLLIGARLNWLLSRGHGKWNPEGKFIQIDIDPMEMDVNRPITAPVVGDIGSVLDAMIVALPKHTFNMDEQWVKGIQEEGKVKAAKFAERLAANPTPMTHWSALGAVKKVLEAHPEIILVNEGANTLDDCRNAIDMSVPRHRIDCATWAIMGMGMGMSIGAAVATGSPVVAVEGDSAFGFSGMEVSTICRFKLPVTVVVFNNGGIYNGIGVNLGKDNDPAPTTLDATARYDKIIEAFGGQPYNATTPDELTKALEEGIASGKPTLINVVLNPASGEESGHIGYLNPAALSPIKV